MTENALSCMTSSSTLDSVQCVFVALLNRSCARSVQTSSSWWIQIKLINEPSVYDRLNGPMSSGAMTVRSTQVWANRGGPDGAPISWEPSRSFTFQSFHWFVSICCVLSGSARPCVGVDIHLRQLVVSKSHGREGLWFNSHRYLWLSGR